MKFTHCGLFCSEAQLASARQSREQSQHAPAWATLERQVAARDPLACALAWRLTDDARAAEVAQARLLDALASPPFPAPLAAAGDVVSLAQTTELLRGQLPAQTLAQVAEGLQAALTALDGRLAQGGYVQQLWLALARMSTAVVLEDAAQAQAAAEVFRMAVEGGEIRPQGFIQPALDDQQAGCATAMERQVLATAALVLLAEAGTQAAGLDLWGLHARGVSIATAAMYPIYYFFTTARWKWDADLAPETVQDIFRRHSGWVEVAQARLAHKDLAVLLSELRPVWDRAGGGLTTLTHGIVAEKPRRRGLFG
jgi:hypothetical protein